MSLMSENRNIQSRLMLSFSKMSCKNKSEINNVDIQTKNVELFMSIMKILILVVHCGMKVSETLYVSNEMFSLNQ